MNLEEHNEEIEAARVGRKMLAAARISVRLQGGLMYTVPFGARLVKLKSALGGTEMMASMASAGGVYTVVIPRVDWKHIDLEPERKRPHERA